MDGDYTLSGLEMNDVIVVTILGYKDAQAVWTGQQKLNFTLEVSTEFLDEVVVTALGIKREEKTLSYNVQKVDSDKLTTVKDANFVNSLVGKVAGVQINSGASGPGSTTRVVMRGMKSIEKNNTVLYVIDGVHCAVAGVRIAGLPSSREKSNKKRNCQVNNHYSSKILQIQPDLLVQKENDD